VNERIWTETKLKSEEMLAAVESALQLVGDQIDQFEKERILQLDREVRETLDSHETQKLKQANQALDSATQNLAALIVENAMKDARLGSIAPP
jgi:molecular chaperone DnaK